MPYVKQARRDELDSGARAENAGDLAYLLTRQIDNYLSAHPEEFERYADVMAALEGTKLELYRRRLGPYEDTKIAANGDVFTATADYEIADMAARGQ